MRPYTVVTAAILALACAPAEPPPAGAEDSLRWLYRNFETASDADVLQAFANFDAAVGASIEDTYGERLFTTLEATDVVDSKLANDPTTTFGILAANELGCPLDAVLPIHVSTDQNGIHGGYDAYDRRYLTDAELWPQELPFLRWNTDYTLTVPLVSVQYSAKIHGGVRSIPAEGKFPSNRVVLGRAWLTEPATFTEPGDSYFRQDYQLDLFYERGEGRTLHVFAAWREMKMSFLGPEDTTGFMFNASKDADGRIAERCAK